MDHTGLNQFLIYRDSSINHELFGALSNFRDLQFAAPYKYEDFEAYSTQFRKIFPYENDSKAPLITDDPLLSKNAIFIITKDSFTRTEGANFETPDGVLSDPPINSNTQFLALLNSKHQVWYLDLLSIWISRRCPVKRNISTKELTHLIYQFKTDDIILQKIYQYFYNRPAPPPQQLPPPNSQKRVSQRVKEIKTLLKDRKISSALDIGCSDGFIIQALGQELQINVVGIDIRPPQCKIKFHETTGSEFVDELEGQFDLVCIMMTLHHVEKWKIMIKNALKYLKKGGFLFIRDHDAFENDYKILLDLHDQAFNSCIWETPESDTFEFQKNCRSWFLSYLDVKEEILTYDGLEMVEKFNFTGQEFDWRCYGSVWYALFNKE
ncbi:Methyltransferase domain-containing protein [Spironucleus salmonicida]|uniref:Methyltransferase domain-containing protein n=1 Tax=Spironucleus salmonicida TaxID=348837 RepID=V6LT42_9EUKA|nr:Methyltransferase domain-containing protein [Spironucleus salmonicida]|eukprot:EST47817.1 Methyltransferase domain-containing protein [Spironucleus salmonicida]